MHIYGQMVNLYPHLHVWLRTARFCRRLSFMSALQSTVMWDILVIRIAMHNGGRTMKTVQMTLDESLVTAVDRAAKRLGTTRSAFARAALRRALEELKTKELELKHRDGYRGMPVGEKEFSAWGGEQVWGEP